MKKIYQFTLAVFLLTTANIFAQNFTDSNLPIVIITTDLDPNTGNPLEILDDPRILASMKIIKHADGTRNYLSDQNTTSLLNYNGRINIEIRGSSSQELPKKQYGLTTLQADNASNNNVSLLGMPSENDWILNGLAFDPSLIRDYLSYNLARQIGDYAPRTEFCEVVINGDYKGLYILQEKIKADSNRVNVVKITAADNAAPNITGGYITKSDKTTGGDPVVWSMSSYTGGTVDFIHELPKPEDVIATQNSYIHSQFSALAATSHANNTSLLNGYPAIIDIPSFVDFMLITELSSNVDTYQISTYYHKDRGGKLRAGPIWDFNLTYGNDLFQYGFDRSHYDVWQFDNGDSEGPKFWKDLFNNPTYKCYFSRRWNELTAPGKPLKHNNLVIFIDETVASISEAAVREDERWGTVNNHALEIENLKSWLLQRVNWIIANIGPYSDCSNITTPALVINKINYNPGTNTSFPVSNDQEFIEIKNSGSIPVVLTGIYLRELGVSYQFPANTTVSAGESVYIASNSEVFQSKYGFPAFGQFTRNLSNSKQKLVLADGFGNIIDTVEYTDSSPWPNADGNGSYLQLTDTSLDNSLASSWTATDSSLGTASYSVNTFSVYPNPVQNQLTIKTFSSESTVSILDISGKLLQTLKIGSGESAIDFSQYSRGLYFVKVASDGVTTTEKIIKQ